MYENYVFGGLHALHNDYMQILVDIGRPGLSLYLFISDCYIPLMQAKVIRRKGLDHLKINCCF